MVEIKNVSFGYRRSREVLSDITVDFAEGMVHGLLGRNGIGKTTLLKISCGLLSPTTGTVSIDGQNPALHAPSLLARVMVVPEEFDLPGVTLASYAKHTAPFYPTFDQTLFERNCEAFEVNRNSKLDAMSMGERKKSYIAFALACSTPYLLMDEPTNSLDIPAKAIFRRLLAAHADNGHTVIISTHQVADLERLIDNVVILDTQGVALNAPTAKIEKKLRFGLQRPGEEPIYAEESLVGTIAVTENRDGSDTTTDLGLLFNAVLSSRERITEIMNR